MFNVKWDGRTNGILLTDEDSDLTPPRPVFYQELNLLGFNKYWSYPTNTEYPLLWANGRRYFYKGNLVAIAKKGNALELPDLIIEEGYENLQLEPIDIPEMIKRNKDALFRLEHHAIDFVEEVSTKYPNYPFSVSFSGGKDSQAVLDLIVRLIHADDITVIFSDTTLEHEFTYSTIDETIEMYKLKYPNLKFDVAKPPKSANQLFEDMGLPSRFHRWCTPVLKTAPYNKLINSLVDDNSKIIVFEGVRAEESAKRSKYKPIADGVKHPSIINCRPIFDWNFSEVVLYNFYRDLPINPLYKYGLSRVGCELCPYSSEWSECIYGHLDDKFINEYIPLIKKYASNRSLSDEKDLNEFVKKGHWKKRAGGKGLDVDSNLEFKTTSKSFKSISLNPKESFLEWIKVLGDVSYQMKNNDVIGELNIDGKYISFSLITKNNKEIIEFFNIHKDIRIQNKLKRILNKSTFCTHCGVCEVECTECAIQFNPGVQINSNLCNHCENCIKFTGHGCYCARSVNAGSGGKKMSKKTSGIDRYSTFGLRQIWLDEFFEIGDEWLEDNTLGPKQVPAVRNWLIDANLIDAKSRKLTPLGSKLRKLYTKVPDFVLGVIWTNLYYNSKIINWYCNTIDWGMEVSKNELLDILMDSFPDLSKGTLNNALTAMFNMFENSSLNDNYNLGNTSKKGRVKFINKKGVGDDIDSLLIAYSLYKLKEFKSINDFTVSELYSGNIEGSPYNIFGVSQNQFERILRGLQQSNDNIVKTDLVSDLDNIFLSDALSYEDIINLKLESI